MLARKCRRAESPVDAASLPIDPYGRRDVTEAEQNVAIRQFCEPVAVRPLLAIVTRRGDDVLVRLHMLPGAPFPYGLSICGPLHQVVAVHLGTLLFGTWQAALHAFGDRFGKLRRAQQE